MEAIHRNIFILGVIIFAVFVILFWDYSIDDAFITFRYAEHFADGHGLVFNIGDSPLEGYSNFLWLLVLALLYKIGLPTYLMSKLIGVLCFLLAAYLFSVQFKENERRFLPLSGALFLISPVTAFWAVSGLELGLHTLLLILAIIMLFNKSQWLYLILPLLVISRPEGVGVGVVLLLAGFISDLANKNRSLGFTLWGFIIVIVTFGALEIFRLQVFGYPLPNTYYAKSHYESVVYGYLALGKMMLFFAPLTVALILSIKQVIKIKLTDKKLTIFVSLFLFQGVVSSSVDPIMNFYFRYMISFLPLLIAISLIVVSTLIKGTNRHWTAALLISISLLLPVKGVMAHIDQEMEIREAQESLINWAEQLPHDATISMIDMGRVPYYTDKIYYDLYGLVNKDIAHDGYNPRREFARLPDFFVLVGYLDEDKMVLRFGRAKAFAYTETFKKTYKLIDVHCREGANPNTPGYSYLVFVLQPDLPSSEAKNP